MNLVDRVVQSASRVLVLGASLLVLAAPSEAEAVFDCLPKPNCRNVAECCKKPRAELALQIARAEMRRDFYKSTKNRDDAFKKGAWDSTNSLEKAFVEYISTHQDAAAKKRLGIKSSRTFDDVPTLTTNAACKTTIDANGAPLSITDIPKLFDDPNHPLTKADVCREAVVAAVYHEVEHQDRCEARKAGHERPPTGKGPARRELDESADDEQDAYAREAETLRLFRKQARRRCTTARALANDDFDNAKQKLKALALMRQPGMW